MNDTDSFSGAELGPMPDATVEEPQHAPGGVDAVEVDDSEERADSEPRDLDPDRNPSVDDVLPDELAEPDDKAQAPAEGSDDEAGGSVTGGADGQPEDSGEVSGHGESGDALQD